jgi:hypothetical protein
MKKLTICLICILFSVTVWAQEAENEMQPQPIQKGAKTFGGFLALEERSNFIINAGAGYFFTDQFALGGNLNLAQQSWNLDIRGRYYFPIIDRTYIFIQAALNLDNMAPIYFTVGPGITYFLNDRVGVEGNMNNLGGGGIGLVFLFK